MFWNKTKTLAQISSKQDLKSQIKRARILVIDDDPNAFPAELLKEEGYNVTYWQNVKSLAQLENGDFDLIILDLNDIATPAQSASDGIGILRHIKSYNPAQIVVAYSAKKYDFRQGDFWKLADDFLGKPSPLDVCKQKIDELLISKFNVNHYWMIIRRRLEEEGATKKQTQKLEALIVKRAEDSKSISVSDIGDIVKLGKESLSAIFTSISIIGKILSDG